MLREGPEEGGPGRKQGGSREEAAILSRENPEGSREEAATQRRGCWRNLRGHWGGDLGRKREEAARLLRWDLREGREEAVTLRRRMTSHVCQVQDVVRPM